MGIAKRERQALCGLFDELGPDAPTLCESWRTRDLAAHLVLRERRPDAMLGILVKSLAEHTRQVQDGYAARPWPELVDLVRGGPPWYWPTNVDTLNELANTAEFLVHHEDVRRAQPGWRPGPEDPVREDAAWRQLLRSARLTLRRSPVGVVVRTPSGREASARTGPDPVTLTGTPLDLLLYTFGRDAVEVTVAGSDSAVAAFGSLSRGL